MNEFLLRLLGFAIMWTAFGLHMNDLLDTISTLFFIFIGACFIFVEVE